MDEIERTYLARYLPSDLCKFPCKEIIDIYVPALSRHPKLRIRKNGNRYEITKKEPLTSSDASHQQEQTISLLQDEFEVLSGVNGKRIRKIRYTYEYNDQIAEIDVFLDELYGFVNNSLILCNIPAKL